MTCRPLAAILLATLLTGPLLAEEPKLPDVAEFDKLVVDALRDVHNRGADLYNTKKEYDAAYRMYQGGLVAVKKLLGHRPTAQKMIDDGLAAAEKETVVAIRAFKLHETIEDVRTYLKDPNAKKDTKPKDKTDPKEMKDPKDKTDPKEKKGNVTSKSTPLAERVSGKVMLNGAPLKAAELTMVTLNESKPRVFTVPIEPDSTYLFKEPLPQGRYVVIVTGAAVPAKYSTTTTSGLAVEVKPGENSLNIELK